MTRSRARHAAALLVVGVSSQLSWWSAGCEPQATNPGSEQPPDEEVGCSSTAPQATITSPVDSATFKPGVAIALTGVVSDAEESDPSRLQVEWQISGTSAVGVETLEGVAATASSDGTVSAEIDELPEGTYTVTLEATDSCGMTGQGSVGIEVQDAAPIAVLDEPAETEIYQGEQLTLTGNVVDPDDDVDDTSITLVDSLEKQLEAYADPDAAGQWSLTVSLTSLGTHTLAVVATDPSGKAAVSNTVDIVVVQYIPLPPF